MDTNSQEKSNEPLYQPLPSGLSSGNVPNVFESDASRVHLRRHVASLLPSTVVADNIYDEKVKAKALMLALNKSTESKKVHRIENIRKSLLKNRKKLTVKQTRALGLSSIPRTGISHADIKPLNELWKGYMTELVGDEYLRQAENVLKKLLKADLHGARMKVTQSKNPSFVGKEGLLLQETQETFKIITLKNRVYTIPKRASIFTVYLDHASSHHKPMEQPDSSTSSLSLSSPSSTPLPLIPTILIYGDQFCYRSADRLARKFKLNSTIDLK